MFIDEVNTVESSQALRQEPWYVLIVDDDQDVHAITKMCLSRFTVLGRPLAFLQASNSKEAKEVLRQHHQKIALSLLDVVMDSHEAGLQLADFIRNELHNSLMRIVLRTGQILELTEEEVISSFDINDLRHKTELSSSQLKVLVYASIRAYQDLVENTRMRSQLESQNRQLETKVEQSEQEQTVLRINQRQLEEIIAKRTHQQQELVRKLEQERKELFETEQILRQTNQRLQESQTQLVQSEKMASLGQMAAGIAHEINNPIGFISSNLTSLGRYLSAYDNLVGAYDSLLNAIEQEQDPVDAIEKVKSLRDDKFMRFVISDSAALISECLEGTQRVHEIVQGLRTFARVDNAELQQANVNDLLEKTIKVAWNELKYNCNLHKEFDDALDDIYCYAGQLTQVFLNLLVNASHALDGKGDIYVKTWQAQDTICISIRDTGCGIKPEVQNQIFNPFFTTKPVGKGTGLGLSISYGIVQKHHGSINFESVPNEGTIFTIQLPKQPTGVDVE